MSAGLASPHNFCQFFFILLFFHFRVFHKLCSLYKIPVGIFIEIVSVFFIYCFFAFTDIWHQAMGFSSELRIQAGLSCESAISPDHWSTRNPSTCFIYLFVYFLCLLYFTDNIFRIGFAKYIDIMF